MVPLDVTASLPQSQERAQAPEAQPSASPQRPPTLLTGRQKLDSRQLEKGVKAVASVALP